APTGRPGKLLAAFAGLEFDPAGLGKILPQEMRGAGLNGLAILHHGLDAERFYRAGESFRFALLAGDDGQCEKVAGKRFVKPEDEIGFLERLLRGFVRGVTLLPEELRGAEE